MKKNISFIIFSTAFGLLSANASVDSAAIATAVKNAVSADKTKVVAIVSQQVAETPSLACEVVKSAIEGSSANVETVVCIVEAAIVAAPDQMNLITKCALTAAPDASAAVYATVAKLGANAATVEKPKPGNNVLDFPSGPGDFNEVGPLVGMASGTAGGAGGASIVGDPGGGAGGAEAGAGKGGGSGGTLPPGGVVTPPVSPNQPL